MIKEILKSSKEEKKFIGIWVYGDDDGFWSGYVIDYNNDFVYIQHYSKYGKSDGVIIELISNIESIDFNDDYSNAMEFLIQNSQLVDQQELIEIPKLNEDNWQFELLSGQLNNEERVVRFKMDNGNIYVGLVDKLDKEFVALNCIGKMGENEDFSLFKLEDIQTIRINDIESRKRLLLYNWRKSSC
jgi:hypothetical protein